MSPYISLAKSAIETYIKEKRIISYPKDLPNEFLTRKAGAFVTIMKNSSAPSGDEPRQGRELRGCIGTYLPTKENVAQEIISNAIAAATEDYRFSPVQEEELSLLSYTVYILSKPKAIKNINELNPKKFGILVKSPPVKSGLLLPDLEGINTIEQQISIAYQKAGINPETEKIVIYKFTVEKYK